jgi:uncharacterized RDD family membrane protein YckC
MPSEVPASDLSVERPPVNEMPGRVVTSFWRRIFAFVVDVLITAMPCAFVGFTFYRFFTQSKLAGDLLGFFIVLPYFVILGSCLGGGQTLGQRIAQIRIVGRDGKCLSLARSFLRYLILLTPMQLSEAEIPVWAPTDLKLIASWLGPPLVVVIGYLYVFNVRTRQSLHDVAVGAYVVDARAEGPIETKGVWKWHWAILGGAFMTIAVLTAFIFGGMGERGRYGNLMRIQRAVLESEKVRTASVLYPMTSGEGSATKLEVNVYWNGSPVDCDRATTEIAAIVLKADPEASKFDYIGVGITQGLKIGFVNFSRHWIVMRRPSEWASKIKQFQPV